MKLMLLKKERRRATPPAFALGLGLFFTGMFVVAAVLMGGAVRGYWKTRPGIRVLATVEAVSVSRFRQRTSIEASYSYRWADRSFKGSRVSLFDDREASAAELSAALENKETTKVWIDPEDPSYSVFDRQWRWFDFSLLLLAQAIFLGGAMHSFRVAAFGPKRRRKLRSNKPALKLP